MSNQPEFENFDTEGNNPDVSVESMTLIDLPPIIDELEYKFEPEDKEETFGPLEIRDEEEECDFDMNNEGKPIIPSHTPREIQTLPKLKTVIVDDFEPEGPRFVSLAKQSGSEM